MSTITLLTMIFLSFAGATDNSVFTAVGSDGQNTFYVGLKTEKIGEGLTSFLVSIPANTRKGSKIKLPNSLSEREIRFISADSDKVFILTQWTIEQGDDPRLDVYSKKSKKWRFLGKARCNSFDRVTLDSAGLTLRCYETATGSGPDKEILKKISLEKSIARKKQETEMPQKHAIAGETKADLSGPAFSENTLTIQNLKKKTVLKARDILN